ncbi:fungal-specific transcription factor domain-containing protein [Coniochaeta sp. 2T2.1]|nr:fungal-specific transcription factor domain-containing protein [Coniochaeta sp. 2T2.1]
MAAFSELKGCETCKERKIRCDKKLPVCGNCRRAHRTCIAALKLRLSWPKTKDRRRFVIGPPVIARAKNAGRPHFLNITSKQIELYLALSENGYAASGDQIDKNETRPLLDIILQNPGVLRNRLGNLKEGSRTLSYFYSVVSDTLPSIPGLKYGFRDLLMRMALQDDGPSSQAVLFSLLSLTTLHQQQHWNEDAVTFKSRSIRALTDSAKYGGKLTLETILQHMAAALVLCRIEISLAIDSSTLWCLFVCGINTLLQEARQKHMTSMILASEDVRLLYRIVHYHFTMSEFGLRHWIRPGDLAEAQMIEFRGTKIGFKCRREPTMPELISHISEEWQFLGEILSLRSTHNPSYYNSKAHQSALDDLEQRIATSYSRLTAEIHSTASSSRQPPAMSDDDITFLAQKRCILAACWIYLLRTERRLGGPSEVITSLIRDAFDDGAASLRRVAECNLPWPVFIIGAEASSEAHRRVLLDLIGRTGDGIVEGEYTPYKMAGELLRDAWAMEDLHAEMNDGGRYLDYERKLHVLFTASEVMPALA